VTLNNQHIAIYTKVNELATRYGLKAQEFVAEIAPLEWDENQLTLTYTNQTKENQQYKQLVKMLNAIGGNAERFTIQGDVTTLLTALENAIKTGPQPRVRN
jgi:hypothetical protein